MKVLIRFMVVLCWFGIGVSAWGQGNKRDPHIGFIYPAGGQKGTEFQVLVGGQNLRGVTDVFVSGKGVLASVLKTYRPVRNLNREQREKLQFMMKALGVRRMRELGMPPVMQKNLFKNYRIKDKKIDEDVELPEHPLFENFGAKSIRDLFNLQDEVLRTDKRQLNRQISELVTLSVKIDSKASIGDYELRLGSRAALSNPMCFQVGVLPETNEIEPNDPNIQLPIKLPPLKPYRLPIVFNGQIKPGDVDHFRFTAKQGQNLVVRAYARHLVPYLADAVPGWFQATMALYNDKGQEIAFVDDYRFDPDPVLFYTIPENGAYTLGIRDSIYRGREDFVYRIEVGELPFVTKVFQMGGQVGSTIVASLHGWNLPQDRIALDMSEGIIGIREMRVKKNRMRSNPIVYDVGALEERYETEPNDSIKRAQRVLLSKTINGRVEKPGDVDVYKVQGKANEKIAIEVTARRLNSPMDSLLRLTDSSGKVIDWNDDYENKELGLSTHHADSYLLATFPQDGDYYIHLLDAQNQGGNPFTYRLRISTPQPDYALRIYPSSVNIRTGQRIPIWIHALRKDGFDGEIEIKMRHAPKGFQLRGTTIPAGQDRVRMTLSINGATYKEPVELHLDGFANIHGKRVKREAVPADDMMQAFIYRHLVPSKDLLVKVNGPKRNAPPVELVGEVPVQIPTGGSAKVQLSVPKYIKDQKLEFELKNPPSGISLGDVRMNQEGLVFDVKLAADNDDAVIADNLIVEAFSHRTYTPKGENKQPQTRRISLGYLPAIPIQVVSKNSE
jgi:hypothetical protein